MLAGGVKPFHLTSPFVWVVHGCACSNGDSTRACLPPFVLSWSELLSSWGVHGALNVACCYVQNTARPQDPGRAFIGGSRYSTSQLRPGPSPPPCLELRLGVGARPSVRGSADDETGPGSLHLCGIFTGIRKPNSAGLLIRFPLSLQRYRPHKKPRLS